MGKSDAYFPVWRKQDLNWLGTLVWRENEFSETKQNSEEDTTAHFSFRTTAGVIINLFGKSGISRLHEDNGSTKVSLLFGKPQIKIQCSPSALVSSHNFPKCTKYLFLVYSSLERNVFILFEQFWEMGEANCSQPNVMNTKSVWAGVMIFRHCMEWNEIKAD